MQIDPTLYRALYDEALGLVRAMVPQLAEHALGSKQSPSEVIGESINEVFDRVLQCFEGHMHYLEPPEKRKVPAGSTSRKSKPPKQWDPFA